MEIKAHFGAVLRPDGTLNDKRHGYTTDMIGRAVLWTYSPTFRIVHVYRTERYYNVTMPRSDRPPTPEQIEEGKAMAESFAGYKDPTEPALYIRIKKGIYVFAFAEQNLEKFTGPKTRGNSLAFLMDLERMFDVGRSFGTNANQQPENYCFGAYGQEIPFPEEFKNFQSGYYI